MNTDDCEALTELLFPHMSGSGLGKDTVGYDMAQYEASRLARIVVAAGWRPPKPPCEHRMIVHGGACGSCGQMPPPPTEEDLALLRTALARVERDNGTPAPPPR